MTPAAIIALVRDVVILVALALLVWLLIQFGRDRVKIVDMKAVQTQLAHNARQAQEWKDAADHATTIRDQELAQLRATAAQPRPAIRVCHEASPRSVPIDPATASREPAPSGGIVPGPRGDSELGTDIRPQIEQFKLKYESALAECRAALASWPSS